jgi:iron complex transport system substrate-binding protein
VNELPKVFSEILGKYVNIPDKPERIVSFSPAITECLFMLGMGDSVEAVSAFCVRPEEAKKKRRIGSYNTVRDELLESIKPDIIFTVTGYQRDFALRLSEKYNVFPFELPVSVAGIIDTLVKLGLLFGKQEMARSISYKLIETISSLRKPANKLKVYVEIDLGGPVTFGAYSYITDAIELLNCENIYGKERCEWLTPDLSYVKMVGPDVFIYEAKMFSKFSSDELHNLIEERSLSSLDFFKKQNFFLTPGPYDFLAHHGPSFVLDAMPWLSEKFLEAEKKLG